MVPARPMVYCGYIAAIGCRGDYRGDTSFGLPPFRPLGQGIRALFFRLRLYRSLRLVVSCRTPWLGFSARRCRYWLAYPRRRVDSDNHTVPTHDLFSFSKPGAPWFAWEWLSDVIFALLFRVSGFKGVVLLAGAIIGIYSTIVLRHTFWRGANAMIALPLVLLGVGSSSVHFLARPHVFTFLFLAVAFWLIDADRRRTTRHLWLLIPLTVLWVNLHGGVFMFLACLGLLVLGSAGEVWLSRKSQDWRGSGALCAATRCCCARVRPRPS